ncbi:hypothetical protein DWV75_02045 [Ruminococcus sp. AF12-5]|nr:hypothetical protein DWV75_02045 [Ruminococcus sp. AF12-5]
MATGYARITVSGVTAVGTIQSTHQYDVTATFEIAISPYGRNETGGANYSITIDRSNSGSRSCTFNSRGGYVTIGSYTKRVTVDKSGQAKTINISAALNTGISPSSISESTSYTLPAVTWQWSVSYNANGGSGAPENQTKTYGSNLTLSSTKPTRTGYTFLGWSTSPTATSATYQPDGTYTSNSGATLYAVWKINTYTVSYNANGGSGAPGNQTKTYGSNLTLSSTKPTRTNYNFKGWSKDKNAVTATYSAGGVYTEDTAVTLYAVWELAYWSPKITKVSLARCNSGGALDNYGTYAKVTFDWECCQIIGANSIGSIAVGYAIDGSTTFTNTALTASGTKGSASVVIGSSKLSVDNQYNIQITVIDSKKGTSTSTYPLSAAVFTIDFKNGGKGIAIGKPADTDNLFDVNWATRIRDALTVNKNATISGKLNANGGLTIGNNPVNDYVIAQGRSGIWTYRKWNSGFAECWCVTSNYVAANTKWGNAFYSTYIQGGYALPFTFATNGDIQDDPQGFVEIQSTGGNYWFQVANSCTTTNAPKGYVMCPIQHNDTIQVLFSFYIRGRWK